MQWETADAGDDTPDAGLDIGAFHVQWEGEPTEPRRLDTPAMELEPDVDTFTTSQEALARERKELAERLETRAAALRQVQTWAASRGLKSGDESGIGAEVERLERQVERLRAET